MGHPPRLAGTSLACLLLLLATAASASIDPRGLTVSNLQGKCTVGCHGMHPGKAYQEGRTYVYNLEGLSVTSVTDAPQDATLKVAATVEMSVKRNCVHQLRLKNVLLNGEPPSSPDVEQYAVQFNYHDGHVDTELCTEPGDSPASLNIKRAVVSMFQSAVMQDSGSTTHHETDVMGACPTEFSFDKEGETLTVRKNRNLAQCAYRENVDQGLVSASVDTAADVKSSPLLASQQEVEQRFKRGVLNKAVSKETYRLRPFSNGNAGAKTTVETKLTLKGEKDDNPTAEVSQPKSLLFESAPPTTKSSPEVINNALKAAKAEVAGGVKPQAASKFADLVKTLRQSKKNDMMSVYQKARGDKQEQKLFLEALFLAASGSSVEMGVELLKNKELQGVQQLLFYASLALVRHVDLSSTTAVISLLDQPNLPRLGYLGVGQVIGKYCQQNQCENVAEVKDAVHKIREKVGNGKTKTREQQNMVVSALKALGNTQFLDDATLQKLANVAADKNVRNRVRVAAMEALPARCSMKWKNVLFKVLADREEDSEVRIKAYLALVACPCPHVANNLKEVLSKETVNQVGSFIQSHLRNLRASTDPSKQNAKNQLGLLKPRAKFPEDFRKFSFNNELSYKLDAFGVGAMLENNVIYSQNSFVPRSTSLNMTMELFGRNFNFLELNTRAENLDRVVEQYIGPKGKVMQTDVKELTFRAMDKLVGFGMNVREKYGKYMRAKREVKQGELDRFAKNVRLRGNEVDEDVDLDFSVKLFGVELAYLTYQGDMGKLNPDNVAKMLGSGFESLKEKGYNLAKDLNYDLQNYMQFLDAELVYPTNLGAALNLGLVGTSAVRVKTHGKLDLRAILENPSKANFRVGLDPSVSVRVAGNMAVQGLGAEAGMKLVTTLHTTTSSDLTVSVLDGKGVDVNFGIPKKKQELVSVSSEVLFSTGPKGAKYVASKFGKGKEHSDCFDQFSTVLGLTVCGQLAYPYEDLAAMQQKPLFPLSGPAKFAVTVENNDVNSFHFKVYHNVEEKKRSFEVLMDTPNSKTNRRVSLSLEAATEPEKYVRVSFDSPIKKLSAEAVLKNTPQERTLTLTASHDQMEYYARVGALTSGNKYKPVLEYKVPEHVERLASEKTGLAAGQHYNVQGTVDVSDYEGGQKYVFDKVALVANGQQMVVVDGYLVATPNELSMDTNFGYADKSLAFKLNGKKRADNDYAFSVSAMPSTDRNIGFNLNGEFKRGPHDMQNRIVFVHGPDPNSETNRLSLVQSAAYKFDAKHLEDFLLSTSNELTYPLMKLKLKCEGKLTSKSVKADVEVKYEKFNFGTELSAKKDMEKPGDYEVDLEAELMENNVKVKSKRTVVDPNKSKFSNSLVLTPGGRYDADATVVHEVSKNNVNLQLDGDVNMNGKKVKIDTGLEANPQSVNSRVFVKVDGVKYVEFLLKSRRVPNPSGTLTLNLKNYMTANGQYVFKNNKGNANLNVDLPKVNRKVRFNGDLAVSGSEHVGNFELLYDAEKDPSKRVKFSTVSDITKNSVDTKNVLEVLTYKFEVNAKGKLDGSLSNGMLQGDVDVTLPNGRYLVYKVKRNSAKKDNKYDIQVDCELIDHVNKGGPSRKLVYLVDVKDLDMQQNTFQNKAQLKYVGMDGKDVQLSLSGKNLVQGDKKKLRELNLEVSGATMPKRFQLQTTSTSGDSETTYKAKSSLGDDFSLMSSGTYNEGNEVDKPYKMDGVLDLKLPSDKLSNLKLETSMSVLDAEENGLLEYSEVTKLTYNNDKTVKWDAYLKLQMPKGELDGPSSGTGKLLLNVLQLAPLKLEGNYMYTPAADKSTAMLDLNANFGEQGVSFKADNEYLPQLAVVNVKAKGNLLLEKLRNVNLDLVYKRYKDENRLTLDSELTADGNKYTVNGESQLQSTNGLFRLMASCPAGKTELFSKFQQLGEKEFKGEMKVDTPKGFVAADAHVDLESMDDFVIKANFDSDKFKYRKVHAEIANKPTAKTGKRVLVTVTSDGQNLVTGSTSYKKRDEDGKVVVEGSGNLKVGDNTRSSSFKYTRQQLTSKKDGEVGVAMVLNANFGPSAIVGELKLSDKEVHVSNSYCEQNKDCAHVEFLSTLELAQKSLLKHEVRVEVDLRKFNVPAEFGLKTSTELRNPMFDHKTNLYLHTTKEKSEYTYHLYVHPKEAATVLTLPSREMALVLTYDLPKTKQTGAYKMDMSLYLDRKNKPNDKTSLSANGDINVDKNSLSLSGETKFTYPTQTKDMSVKGRLHCGFEHLLDASLDVDVFAKKSQKISLVVNVQKQPLPGGANVTAVAEVNSRGQQLKLDLKTHAALSKEQVGFGSLFTYNDVNQKPKTMGALFSADLNHVFLLITLPDKELFREDTKMMFTKNLQKVDTEVSVLGESPEVMNFEANDMNRFKFQLYPKDKPNNKLSVTGQAVLGQLAEVHADLYKEGAKKNLFHVLLHLDEKQFLKPDFGYNKDNVAEALDTLKNRHLELAKRMKEVHEYVMEEVKTEGTDLVEHLKKAQPNMKPLVDYYQGELNKLKEELHADETAKELQAMLNKYFGPALAAVTEVMKQAAQSLEKLQQKLNELMSNLKEAFKSMYPQLKASYGRVFGQVMNILDAVSKLANTYLQAVLNLVNEHQKELQDAMNMVSEMTQDFARVVSKGLEQLKQNLEEFTNLLMNQLKALPLYENLKERYQNLQSFQLPETLLSPVEELCKFVNAVLPTEELRQFLDTACNYLLKHLRREKVDEMNELKKLYSQMLSAAQSVVSIVQKKETFDNLSDLIQLPAPIDLSFLTKLPGVSTLRVSLLNLLRSGELPSPLDLYYTYRPTLYASDVVPPFSKSGVITDGGHIFTFDGRHLTIPGTCTYVLAQDMMDGNFSVVANFNKGVLLSVTVTEPKESITMKNNGNLLVNNNPADYPATTKNLQAYLVQPFANVKSDYGVRVTCSSKAPMVCAVHVSGFYQGKLRGLLGDGNNEPYDDFTLPSGKVTESATEFGNAYKLKGDCPDTTAVEHAERAPVCTEYFTGNNSPLRSCFNYVNPANYRDACDHAVAANTPGGACLIAAAYHYSCYTRGIMSTNIPSTCASCKVGTNKIEVGDTFSVKVPKKEVDVIFVVEQQKENEKLFQEMVMPLMSELKEELKQQGLKDVHMGLIGFSEDMKYPQHYTVNGDTNINGEVKNMEFHQVEPGVDFKQAKEGSLHEKLSFLKHKLDVELGTFKLTDAYEEAIRYPFRPGAARAVVGIIANPCEKSLFPLSLQQVRLLLGLKIYKDLGLTYNHVSFTKDLLVSGKPQKNVVGYDQDSVYTFADSKKKPLSGSSEMKRNLAPSIDDVCADFAVSSGGAAFSSDNFLDAKPNQKKQFLQVAAKRIADGLVSVEFEKDCSCQYKYGLVGRPQCKIVARKEAPSRFTKEGVKG